jgi:hypothetical protein
MTEHQERGPGSAPADSVTSTASEAVTAEAVTSGAVTPGAVPPEAVTPGAVPPEAATPESVPPEAGASAGDPTKSAPSPGATTGGVGASAGPELIAPAAVAPPDYTAAGVPSLDYVRDKIEGRYANSLGSTELAEQTPEARSFQEQAAKREEAAQGRLEAIRRSLRGGSSS